MKLQQKSKERLLKNTDEKKLSGKRDTRTPKYSAFIHMSRT